MKNLFDLLAIFGAKYLIFLILLLVGVFVWQQEKNKRRQIAVFAIFSLPITYLLAKLAGYFFYNSRPFVVGNFQPLIAHAADNGFPSDHTLFGAALAMLVFQFNKKFGLALFVLTLWVGSSRVYAGVHHWVDILGSLLIASVVAFGLNFLKEKKKFKIFN